MADRVVQQQPNLLPGHVVTPPAGPGRLSAPASRTPVSLWAVRVIPRSRSLTDLGERPAASASSSCVSLASVRSFRSSPAKLSSGSVTGPASPHNPARRSQLTPGGKRPAQTVRWPQPAWPPAPPQASGNLVSARARAGSRPAIPLLKTGEIWEANLDGTSGHAIFNTTTLTQLGGPTANSSNLYWADHTDGTINEANLDGTSPRAIVTGQNDPLYVAVGP